MILELIEDFINFDNEIKYPIVHCISADTALGAGFAKEIPDIHRKEVQKRKDLVIGDVVLTKCNSFSIYHLVTKTKYWHKPTEATFLKTITNLEIHYLKQTFVCPKLGCGLDKMSWRFVRNCLELSPHEFIVYIGKKNGNF